MRCKNCGQKIEYLEQYWYHRDEDYRMSAEHPGWRLCGPISNRSVLKKVKCIEIRDAKFLTLGKIYSAKDYYVSDVEILQIFADDNKWSNYLSYRFEDVNRKEKLERILKCK